MTGALQEFEKLPLTPDLVADLRSDHAGECGAVSIYTGILAVTRDPDVREFAATHRDTERVHRDFFDSWLPRRHHSRLLSVWKAAGWLLGAVSAFFGASAVYHTVAAVETFVEQHYRDQIDKMSADPALAVLAAKLRQFCEEEVEHRDDAAGRLDLSDSYVSRLWSRIVGSGSSLGVAVAKRI